MYSGSKGHGCRFADICLNVDYVYANLHNPFFSLDFDTFTVLLDIDVKAKKYKHLRLDCLSWFSDRDG